MPTLSFTYDEKESVRRIVGGLGTTTVEVANLSDKLDALTDAQAVSVRADIIAFNKIKYGTVRVKGGGKGQDFDIARDRFFITNSVRQLLNYPIIASADDPNEIVLTTLRLPPWGGHLDENHQ